MNTNDLFWLAGIWEGEGTIAVYRHGRERDDDNNRLVAFIAIANNDPNIIEAADRIIRRMDVVMQVVNRERPNERHAAGYLLQCRKFEDIHTVLSHIVPYMKGQKRAIGILTMRFIESRLRRLKINRNMPPTELDDRLHLGIRKLNKRGQDKIKMDTSETIRKALTASEDIVRTNGKPLEAGSKSQR